MVVLPFPTADGTGKTNASNNPAHESEPAWSPDATKIAFNSDRDGDFEVYTMNPDGRAGPPHRRPGQGCQAPTTPRARPPRSPSCRKAVTRHLDAAWCIYDRPTVVLSMNGECGWSGGVWVSPQDERRSGLGTVRMS
jgi:hypothetical protein